MTGLEPDNPYRKQLEEEERQRQEEEARRLQVYEPDYRAIAWGIIIEGLVAVAYLLMSRLCSGVAAWTGQEDVWILFFLNAGTVFTGVALLVVSACTAIVIVVEAVRWMWSRLWRR